MNSRREPSSASDPPVAPAMEVRGLTKTFGRGKSSVRAVRGVDFDVEPGQVYGFLGPNGAGKSTTIRMIMDLVRPNAGSIRIFGRDVRAGSRASGAPALRSVGAMVEGALFYEHLTGRRNLEVLARTHGKYASSEIDALLDRVSMTDRADRPVAGYSMGMKQRLGVAAALLGEPRLVILDEPTNGLDPAGIREMRVFIRQLADGDGLTVFLSSHLLAEIEQVCDRVAIINEGRIVREGKVSELLADQEHLRLEVSDGEHAAEILGETWDCQRELDGPGQVSGERRGRGADETLRLDAPREATPIVIRRLLDARIDIFEARRERRSLEDFFLEVTSAEVSTQGDIHA